MSLAEPLLSWNPTHVVDLISQGTPRARVRALSYCMEVGNMSRKDAHAFCDELTPEPVGDPASVEVLVPGETAIKAHAREMELYSDGRMWNPTVVAEEIQFWGGQYYRAVFEIGRRLIWARAEMNPQEFETWCKARVPFSMSQVRKYMQAARPLIEFPKLRKPLETMGLEKLITLSALPPDMLDTMTDEGMVAGFALEDLEAVPYRELKKKVAELTAERDRLLGENQDRQAGSEKTEQVHREEVQKLKAELGDSLRRKVSKEDAHLNGQVDTAMQTVDAAFLKLELILDDLAAKLTDATPKTKARIFGLVEHIEQRSRFEAAAFRRSVCDDMGEATAYANAMRQCLMQPMPGGEEFELPKRRIPLGGLEEKPPTRTTRTTRKPDLSLVHPEPATPKR